MENQLLQNTEETDNNNNEETNFPLEEKSIYYYNTSKNHYHAKEFNKALKNIIIYIKLVPNNPKAYTLKGKVYMNLGLFEQSLASFLKSIKLGENTLETIYGYARVNKELNKFDEALRLYKTALEMNPSPKSYYLLANCLYSMGNKEEAIELYNKAIKLNPKYAEAYFNKGIALSNLNLKKEAILMYNKTIELNNNFVDAYFQRGYCFYSIKKYQKAM